MNTPETNPDAAASPAEYRVELDAYNGPLDLLLYLIRRDEVDIYDIPIAHITGRYLAYVDLLRRIDPDAVGDFLVLAATLMEIKSRTLLPRPPAVEDEDDLTDPRMELVRQLLEYRTYKDAARRLDTAAEIQVLKHPRHPVVPPSDRGEIDVEDVQLWDLVEAFRALLEATGQREAVHDVVYDDTPIALHAADVLDSLERAGGVQMFKAVFEGRTKAQLIGLFLALLELLRRNRIRAVQEVPFGPISLQLIDATPVEVDEQRDYAYHPADSADDENDTSDADDTALADDQERHVDGTADPSSEPALLDEQGPDGQELEP